MGGLIGYMMRNRLSLKIRYLRNPIEKAEEVVSVENNHININILLNRNNLKVLNSRKQLKTERRQDPTIDIQE